MAIFYITLGMLLGTTLTVNQVSAASTAVLLLTILGGAWVDLATLGGAFEAVANLLPFSHALDATRAVPSRRRVVIVLVRTSGQPVGPCP